MVIACSFSDVISILGKFPFLHDGVKILMNFDYRQNLAGQNPTVSCWDAADAVEHFGWSFIHGSMNFQPANSQADTLYVNPPEALNSAYYSPL